MSDLGDVLRKAREQRGYTLDDVQEITKIRKRYLEAIETGDYKVLPGSFYVRAFVKTYAETVGLDAEEVLRLYQQDLPTPAPDTVSVQPQIKTGRRTVQHSDRWGKVAVSMLMWAFPILIAVVIYVYLSNNNSSRGNELEPSSPPISTDTAPATSSPTASAPTEPSPTVSATPSPSPAVAITQKETRSGTQYYEISPNTGHKLQIDVTGRCWVEVRDGGKSGEKLYSAIVETPQTLSYDVPGVFYVSIGRSDLAAITIDGVSVDDGDKAARSKFVFTPVESAPAQ